GPDAQGQKREVQRPRAACDRQHVFRAKVICEPPFDPLDGGPRRQNGAAQHLPDRVQLRLAEVVLKERYGACQWSSRSPAAEMMGMWRIHICGRHQLSFLRYQSIVRSSPSSKVIRGRQSSNFSALARSQVCRKTWPGRSPMNSMGTSVFIRSLTAVAI